MGLAFHTEGRIGDDSVHVPAWRNSSAAAATGEGWAETFLGHDDDEITAKVEGGRLILETRDDVKNAIGADGREPRHAYFRLSIDLPTSVLADLSEIMVARVEHATRLLG